MTPTWINAEAAMVTGVRRDSECCVKSVTVRGDVMNDFISSVAACGFALRNYCFHFLARVTAAEREIIELEFPHSGFQEVFFSDELYQRRRL
jgi:hypothetical protein